jgi:hypothetical protein
MNYKIHKIPNGPHSFRQEMHECRLLAMAENSLVELARTRQKNRWESS